MPDVPFPPLAKAKPHPFRRKPRLRGVGPYGLIDRTGERHANLTAIRIGTRKVGYTRYWVYRCDCGNEIERSPSDVGAGKVLSCGCLRGVVKAR
jgi:hypothetical protein